MKRVVIKPFRLAPSVSLEPGALINVSPRQCEKYEGFLRKATDKDLASWKKNGKCPVRGSEPKTVNEKNAEKDTGEDLPSLLPDE